MSEAYFVKAICGHIIHKEFDLPEGSTTRISKDLYEDFVLKRWEKEGLVKLFTDYDEALDFKYKGLAVLAAESLASLNPPLDNQGNPLPFKPATYDFVLGKPIKAEYNYIDKPVVEETVVPAIDVKGKKTDNAKADINTEDTTSIKAPSKVV